MKTRSPDYPAKLAIKNGCSGIVWMVYESTLLLDYVIDASIIARKKGLFVVFLTNGYLTPEAVKLLVPVIDAVGITVKGFGDPESYKHWLEVGEADPSHVLNTIKLFYESGVHVETALGAIAGHADNEKYAVKTARWLAQNVSPDIPVLIQFALPLHKENWTAYDIFGFDVLDHLVDLVKKRGLDMSTLSI